MDPVDNYALSGYASMLNNPISYVDPDGRNPAVIGAAIGAVSYTLQTAFSKGGFKNWDWMKFGMSTISGAVFGGISSGIGESVKAISNVGIRFAVQTGAHSVMGGLNATMNGGTFKSGFISGGVGSVWGSATAKLGPIGQIGGSALFSGISAELSGGNFWQGAAIGGITSGLNHAMHQKEQEIEFFKRLRNHYEEQTGTDFNLTRKEFRYIVNKGISNKSIDYKNAKQQEDGTFRTIIDLYNTTTDLALTFGRATVGYSLTKKNIAEFNYFYDRYDFDPKPYFGNPNSRSLINETLTRTYNLYSSGKAFNIIYPSKK